MKEPTRHHVIPRSRGGKDLENNVVFVERKEHEHYHTLFDNKTPDEILRYLNSVFWRNRYEIERFI